MIYDEREIRREQVIEAAKQMMTAARTAPKAKGEDLIEILLVTGDEIKTLSDKLHAMGEERSRGGMMRDAINILSADAIVLIGTRELPMGLNCAYCGAETCESRGCEIGILVAKGVAVAALDLLDIAADLRLDTRVMYSAGYAARALGWMPDCTCVIAIPVSASAKNPFFDRKSMRK